MGGKDILRGYQKQAINQLKLSGEYALFYLKYIEGSKATGKGTWLGQIASQSYKTWCGFACESVCQKHISQIKNALGTDLEEEKKIFDRARLAK